MFSNLINADLLMILVVWQKWAGMYLSQLSRVAWFSRYWYPTTTMGLSDLIEAWIEICQYNISLVIS